MIDTGEGGGMDHYVQSVVNSQDSVTPVPDTSYYSNEKSSDSFHVFIPKLTNTG